MKTRIVRIIAVNSGIVALLLLAAAAGLYYYGINMPGESYTGNPPELTGDDLELRGRLQAHVRFLADGIGNRQGSNLPALDKAADYIAGQFSEMGYVPRSEMINTIGHRNIVVDLYGKVDRKKILLIGAHYDTTWSSPGADDNASGVAGMLEIARSLHGLDLPVTVRFVAFANEEFPYYGTENMGSLYHASEARKRGEDIVAMFSLEMLGYYSDERRSQYYPRVIRRFYPRTGNFIAFVSNMLSRGLLVETIAAFRDQVQFPSQGLAAPQWLVRGVRRSDHASFWANGYPALMVTDTANYRNYGYHNVGDTAASLDYDRMTIVVGGLARVFRGLLTRYSSGAE